MAKNYGHLFLATLSGLLLALAYPGWSFSLGWLVWVGLIPLFFALGLHLPSPDLENPRSENPRSNLGFSFKIGFITGLAYFLITFRWFWSIYPLDTFGIQSKLISFIAVLLIYLISSAGMALFWGFWSLLNTKYLILNTDGKVSGKWFKKFANLLIFPATFVLFEYFRSWGFGFLWAGSGSLFGPHWTMGNLAYGLAANNLIRWLASYVGIYGVTFLIILVNILLFATLTRKQYYTTNSSPPRGILWIQRMPLGVVGFVVLYIILTPYLPNTFYPFLKPAITDKKINFAIIQTSQPTKSSPSPQESLTGFKEQLGLLNHIAKEYPESQLIIFPEASDFFQNLSLFLTPSQIQNYFSKLFKDPRLIISGGRILDPKTGSAYSRVFSLDTQNDILGFYDKRLLMPGGEFLPYPIRAITALFSKFTVSQFSKLRELNVGDKKTSTIRFRDDFNVAPTICSELASPNITLQTTRDADVIVTMASYGIFHGNHTIADQMLAITRFRAAENKKPIITATNMGRSYIIDNLGNIVFLTQNADPQILTGSVDITQQKSWYNKLGDTPVLIGSLGLSVYLVALSLFRNKKVALNIKFQNSNAKSNPKFK